MRPRNLKTKIFLDSGNPSDTKATLKLLGFLDGQTTNPSLIAKSSKAIERIEKGEKFSAEEIYDFYKKTAEEISNQIPNGSVSVEVYADSNTKAEEMLDTGKKFFSWIPNAHIKLPITREGLKAAKEMISMGMRVNMTLCFNQEQAAAVYDATRRATAGQVFISPFVGRLDDINQNGISLISNILEMYREGDGHVEVLAASIRSIDHFMACLNLGCDIITAPFPVLKEWADKGFQTAGFDYKVDLKDIPYKNIKMENWENINIENELTNKGIEKFCADWTALIV
ncbi:MAG: transaldolase family protein [Candidatus Levyibacteriota bacterium]|jgi:transaldolase